jgi:hypothetical protein
MEPVKSWVLPVDVKIVILYGEYVLDQQFQVVLKKPYESFSLKECLFFRDSLFILLLEELKKWQNEFGGDIITL